jgi:hypothetical protein
VTCRDHDGVRQEPEVDAETPTGDSILAAHVFVQDLKLTVQVTDRASANLPGVTVTVTPVSDCAESGIPAGLAEIVVTNGQGTAAFTAIDRHTYRVEAQLSGFTTETECLRFERTAPPDTAPTVRLTLRVADLGGVVAGSFASPVVDAQPRKPPPAQQPSDKLPRDAVPQHSPCRGQPKSLIELKKDFNTPRYARVVRRLPGPCAAWPAPADSETSCFW